MGVFLFVDQHATLVLSHGEDVGAEDKRHTLVIQLDGRNPRGTSVIAFVPSCQLSAASCTHH